MDPVVCAVLRVHDSLNKETIFGTDLHNPSSRFSESCWPSMPSPYDELLRRWFHYLFILCLSCFLASISLEVPHCTYRVCPRLCLLSMLRSVHMLLSHRSHCLFMALFLFICYAWPLSCLCPHPRCSVVSAVLIFNASLSTYAPSSPIQLPALLERLLIPYHGLSVLLIRTFQIQHGERLIDF